MAGRIARGVWLTVFSLVMWGTMGGCVHQSGGWTYANAGWREHGWALGKVAVIVVGQRGYAEGTNHPAQVDAAVKEALGRLPGTTVIAGAAPAKWAEDVGDREAIAAGKAQGAQSVCVVSVGTYGGMFSMGVPILWDFESRAAYSMRLLDVESGDLLGHCVSYRHVGGWFEICDPSNPLGNLKERLNRDLSLAKKK